MSKPTDDVFLVPEPFIQCVKCSRAMFLPYGERPRTTLDRLLDREFEGQVLWPSDEWRATFGCPKCGCVSSYGSDNLLSFETPSGDARECHDEASLFAATFPCGKMHCKLPATVYTHIESGGAVEYLRLLRSGFFQGKLPCGHDIAAVPEKFYRIERVIERLW